MGRIKNIFEKLKLNNTTGLIPFVTAGDPDREHTVAIMHTLERAGADLIELGMPFSDPAADGPTIQAASQRALDAGTTLEDVLNIVEEFRRDSELPIVLMGYYNPVYVYGVERFAARASQAGLDAVLLVDVPSEHQCEICQHLDPVGINVITMIAPTTPEERALDMLSRAGGFIYYVSMTGVTGTAGIDTAAIEQRVAWLRTHSQVPVAVGFGVSTPDDARNVGAFADAVVVGSALVRIIQQYAHAPQLQEQIYTFVNSLRKEL